MDSGRSVHGQNVDEAIDEHPSIGVSTLVTTLAQLAVYRWPRWI